MKSRTLVTLGIILVVLVLLAKWTGTKPPREAPGGLKTGSRLFSIEDFNKVAGITIADGTQTVELARSGGKWAVASLWNYPANFDRVAEELDKYDQLRVGQAIKASSSELKDFGLDPAATGDDAKKPAVVTLRDADKKELAVLKIGAERNRPAPNGGPGGFADSQYVQIGSGPVVLVDQNLGHLGAQGREWITTQLLTVNAEQILDVDITDRNGKSYGLARNTNMNFYAKQKGEKEEVKDEGARAVFGAITSLNIADIAGPSGSVANAFSGTNAMFRAKTSDGLIYQIDLGTPTGQSTRHARIAVSFEKPSPPALKPAGTNGAPDTNIVATLIKAYEEKSAKDKKAAEDLNAQHAPWIYLVDESSAMNLMLPREQVIGIPSTNPAPPAAESGPSAMPAGLPPGFKMPAGFQMPAAK